jgi:hypothetical protein
VSEFKAVEKKEKKLCVRVLFFFLKSQRIRMGSLNAESYAKNKGIKIPDLIQDSGVEKI